MTCVAKMAASAWKTRENRRRKQGPRRALKSSLRQAAAQERLTVGLSNCIKRLEKTPESVMVCLQLRGPACPGKVNDEAGCKIQSTLLQAFCTENHIKMVQVLADAELMRLVGRLAGKVKKELSDEKDVKNTGGCGWVVIEHPKGPLSSEDSIWSEARDGGGLDICTTGHMPSD